MSTSSEIIKLKELLKLKDEALEEAVKKGPDINFLIKLSGYKIFIVATYLNVLKCKYRVVHGGAYKNREGVYTLQVDKNDYVVGIGMPLRNSGEIAKIGGS